MIPAQVTMIPNFLILKGFGWLDTYQGMIIPSMISATYIFMMRQFFVSFPKELEEAAEIDGLGRFGAFFASFFRWLVQHWLRRSSLCSWGHGMTL